MTVKEYIEKNVSKTVRQPEQSAGFVKMPRPFSVPCINGTFDTFYYWDTYFANLAFLRCGMEEQVKNNLDIMAFFVEKWGFVPNSDIIPDRSQPPLFTRGVYDTFKKTGDEAVIGRYCDAISNELDFWFYERKTPCGLATYSTCMPANLLMRNYDWIADRVGKKRDESAEAKIALSKELFSIAESGWDFTPRFKTESSDFGISDYACLDLNCILYDAETKASEMFGIIGEKEKSKTFSERAENRKKLVNELMLGSDGIYLDYDFKRKKLSPVRSIASLYPYAVGISADGENAKKVLGLLELNYGVSVCEYRGETEYLQWDYPCVWAPLQYFAYLALKNCGLKTDAKRIAEKYVGCVDECFDKTGALWEKYDGLKGSVAVTNEYATPEMMGWTAGVYEFLLEELAKY